MKNLPNIIYQAYFRPVCITKAGFMTVHTLLQNHLMGMNMPLFSDEEEDEDGALPYTQVGKVAIIPIQGIIGNKLGMIEKACGGCDVKDIKSAVTFALRNDAIESILFDVDSPGGSVGGVPETAMFIAQANEEKPCVAFTDGLNCSAAYWLTSGCSAIFATPSSDVGSIGVYQAFLDESLAYANEGIKIEIVKAGKYKAEGFPGTSMSDEFKAMLQEDVLTIYDAFTSHVNTYRSIKTEDMQGQSFMAGKAESRGLIDGVVNDIEEVIGGAE